MSASFSHEAMPASRSDAGAAPPASRSDAGGAEEEAIPLQEPISPLDEGIPGAEPPRVYGADEWQDIQFGKWRDGQQLFLPIAPIGGYIIN